MKRNFILLFVLLFSHVSFSQYIGVKAKYTATRLVPNDDPTLQDSRDNRLVLSFYEVTFNGTDYVWTPTALSNYDIWIEPAGLQFGNMMGGVLDSVGNNYPGYAYTAPRVVSYYNSMGVNYFDCSPSYGTHYVVNGHELDCGWVRVSTWEWNESMQRENEFFNAPNINLPYYWFGHPYYYMPGNVNFNYYDLGAGPPYNMYNFVCGTLQLVMKGLLTQDTGSTVVLPVRFANVRGELRDSNANIEWSNMTESDIALYDMERSTDGLTWNSLQSFIPIRNDGSRADYSYSTFQPDDYCYYRIKAKELNGRSFYSNIIVLRKAPVSTVSQELNRVLTVYPNPVAGTQFTFRLTNAAKGRYISMIVTPDGKQLKQKMIDHNGGGDLVRQINTEGLFPGIYQLVLRSAAYKYSQTIIVSH